MKLSVKQTSDIEPSWHTFVDEGDGQPIRFLIAPITDASQNEIDRLVKDKDFVKSLELDWTRLPKGTGDRRQDLRRVIFADKTIRGWENVVQDDNVSPLECDLYSKVWAMQRIDLSAWVVQCGQEGGAKVVQDEAKNS